MACTNLNQPNYSTIMHSVFINEPNLFLVLSSQAFLLPFYIWYQEDKLTSYIYLFIWFTSTWFHRYPSRLTHILDRSAIALVVLHSPLLIYRHLPYSLVLGSIPYIYNYMVFIYGYKHKKYFFDSNLQIKTAYHAGMHLLTPACITVGAIVAAARAPQEQQELAPQAPL